MALAYKRIVLKLSGEALAGDKGFGIDFGIVDRFTDEVKTVRELGVSVGLVIGGGNIIRGTQASREGMDGADTRGIASVQPADHHS